MKRIFIAVAITSMAGFAIAQETSFASIDADKSGDLSFEELTLVLPDLSVEQFTTADADHNDALSEEEFIVLAENMAS